MADQQVIGKVGAKGLFRREQSQSEVDAGARRVSEAGQTMQEIETTVTQLHTIVADAAGGDPVMAAFFAACDRATALDAKPSNAVDTVLWEKFIALSSLSATTSLLRAPMGLIMGHPETRALQRQLIDEAVVVGRAAGQTVRDNLADEIMAKLAALPAGFRSSMSEDLERGKPLELPWLSGRVHALGLQHGVPTPAHSTAYRALVLYQHGQPAPIAR